MSVEINTPSSSIEQTVEPEIKIIAPDDTAVILERLASSVSRQGGLPRLQVFNYQRFRAQREGEIGINFKSLDPATQKIVCMLHSYGVTIKTPLAELPTELQAAVSNYIDSIPFKF